MNSFDILNAQQPIEGSFLIEASAGTGKTFTIEHTVLKLVQEKKIPLHKILLLTFTQASQKDLMERVFSRLKKGGIFGFLEEMPILTFQKFITRFLQKPLLSGPEPKIYLQLEYFIKTLQPYQEFGPKQLFKLLFSANADSDQTIKKIIDSPKYEERLITFREAKDRVQDLLTGKTLDDILDLVQNFNTIKPFDIEVFEQFFTNIDLALDQQTTKKDLGFLKLSEKNIKARKTIRIPKYIEDIQTVLSSLCCPKMQQALLKELFERHLEEKIGTFSLDFDLFLQRLEDQSFCQTVSQKFSAVIVDEFQDTDPRQWEILSKLFFRQPHIKTFMVVGDPKQSIYRFRNADYTSFFNAKKALNNDELYQLTTCYRFSIALTQALNALFTLIPNPFFPIDYNPVLAGRKELGLEKPLQIVVFEEHPNTKEALQQIIFPWLLTLLQTPQIEVDKTAILVNDRYESNAIEQYLKKYNISVKRIDKTPLKDRLCFLQFDLLLKIFKDPFDITLFRSYYLMEHKKLIEKDGQVTEKFVNMCQRLKSVRSSILEGNFIPFLKEVQNTPLFSILLQKNLTHMEDLYELYDEIYYNDEPFEAADDASAGVELITTFSSKGLEYENVIALSLATDEKRTERSEEDLQENTRLLYVACTRPRERLILPIFAKKQSTINRFFEKIVQPITFENCKKKIKHPYIDILPPIINPQLSLTAPENAFEEEEEVLSSLFYPEKIQALSFSSMEFESVTIEKAHVTEDEIPLGIETGLFVHKILEKIFQDQSRRLDDTVVDSILDKLLLFSPFKNYRTQIKRMVDFVLDTTIDGVKLRDTSPFYRLAESPFSYCKNGQKIHGVFDLILFFQHKTCIIDYKLTHPRNLTTKELMEAFHYDAQGMLYREAIQTVYPAVQDKVEMHFLFLRNEVHYVL
jgi:exodeoxyribonuclease V beta subunit